ncbi:MAG: DNA/RNA helicase domain-containing protein [Negativicutes bacterium]
MARMIPSTISPEVKSKAERKIFEWFRDDPSTSEWIVLHSLGIACHNRVIYGETDFFVLAPNLGVFALEVKGGRVKRKNGIWYFTDKYGKVNYKERGPFDQARDGIFSIIESLKGKLDCSHSHLKNVLYGIGVMFPDIEYSTVGVDEEQWQVFDSNDGSKVGEFVRRIAVGAMQKWEEHYGPIGDEKLPNDDDIKYLATILRGDFDKAVSISVQIKYAEAELVELTKEQYRCLDQIDDNPRCLVQGAAGTGKTLLAIEEAKKAVAKGEQVALFCFNTNLGEWMYQYFEVMPKGLQPAYVGTFHKFMMNIVKIAGVSLHYPKNKDDLPAFFSEDVPEAARVALRSEPLKFDKVIIDEAQDLIKPGYLDIIDLCLSKGFDRGRWTMFGDFSMQAIYADNQTGQQLENLVETRTAFIKFKLTLNCRNTKPICEEIQTITGFNAPSGVWTKVEGPPVHYITFSDNNEQKAKLEEVIDILLDNHVVEKQITILSPLCRENSVVSLVDQFTIKAFKVADTNNISFCTIQAFKGLENTVIILTDISSFSQERLMYVALSRARTGLYILESESASHEYTELQRRRFFL